MSLHYHAWNCKLCYYTIHFISARSAAAFIRKPAASGKCGPGGHTGRPYGGIEGARRGGAEDLALLQKLLSFSKAPGRNREYNLFATN